MKIYNRYKNHKNEDIHKFIHIVTWCTMHIKRAPIKGKPATENFLEICLIKIIFIYNISKVQLKGRLSIFRI